MLTTVLLLLIAFQVKHWLADFPLQTPWMLGKFKEHGWAAPLAAHAVVHAGLTAIIVLLFKHDIGQAIAMGLFDGVIHFCVDRVKASPRLGGRWKPLYGYSYNLAVAAAAEGVQEAKQDLRDNTLFWWAIGADQMAHHLTHYAIIAAVLQ